LLASLGTQNNVEVYRIDVVPGDHRDGTEQEQADQKGEHKAESYLNREPQGTVASRRNTWMSAYETPQPDTQN